MAQGFSAAYTEALIIKAAAPNIAKILFILILLNSSIKRADALTSTTG